MRKDFEFTPNHFITCERKEFCLENDTVSFACNLVYQKYFFLFEGDMNEKVMSLYLEKKNMLPSSDVEDIFCSWDFFYTIALKRVLHSRSKISKNFQIIILRF